MTDTSSPVRAKALLLPREERARLASELLTSLDGQVEPDADVASTWAVELEHRARRALADPSDTEDWASVRDRLRAELDAV